MVGSSKPRSVRRAGPLLLQVQPASLFVAKEIKSYEEWSREITIAVSVLILILLVATLVSQRRRLLEPTAKWIFLLGVVVLPGFAALTGIFTVFKMGERAEFCGSCHPVMDPYINDLLDPKSETLAAVHNTRRLIPEGQCYACHVTYGMNGTFKAKLNGLSHVWKFYTKSWKLPIKLYEEYSNVNCTHCHAGGKKFEEADVHVGLADDLKSGKESCVSCHTPAHPPQVVKKASTEAAR
ncbi:MAG: NapC/NirT family cytochrome c [Candidatus Rokubacteria bacterium]|nr:NapC/NirT family cytochrome c [Candidatus Rokubacteria bacterium]